MFGDKSFNSSSLRTGAYEEKVCRRLRVCVREKETAWMIVSNFVYLYCNLRLFIHRNVPRVSLLYFSSFKSSDGNPF